MIDSAINVFVLASIVAGVLSLWNYSKRRVSHTVVEYQRALLFRKGMPVSVLATGRYTILAGRDVLFFGDVHPQTVSVEDHTVSLRDGAFAQYSFFASTTIKDFKKALYSARNYSELPHFVLRRAARATLARHTRDLIGGYESAEKEIRQRAETELDGCGFSLGEFKLSNVNVSLPSEHVAQQVPPQLLN